MLLFLLEALFSSRNAIETIEKFPKLYGRAELHGQDTRANLITGERIREGRDIKITSAIIISSGFSPFSSSDFKI